MFVDIVLKGRKERRLPIIVVVRLVQAEHQDSSEDHGEKTYTDNISPHGARIFSRFRWKTGEMVRITPLNFDCVYGKVIYCQWLPDGRHALGVSFQNHATIWSTLHRFDAA